MQLIRGNPGDVWVNNTDKVWWQAFCDFQRSCARCIALHHTVGPYFPFPLHDNCNCTQRPIKPGASSEPFIDFEAEVAKLGPKGQAAAMGASNWRLVSSGLAKWSDIVTPGRIRDFREVVDRLDLGVEKMVKAGIQRRYAVEAYEATHTAGHVAGNADRAALIRGLKNHGLSDQRIIAELANLLGSRVGIDGPSGQAAIGGIKPPPPTPPPPPKPIPKPAPKPVPAAKVAQITAAKPVLTGKPIADRITAYTDGDRKLTAIVSACNKIDAARLAAEPRRLELEKEMRLAGSQGDDAGFAKLKAEFDHLNASALDTASLKRDALVEAIRPPDPCPILLVPSVSNPPDQQLLLRVEAAEKFLGSVLAIGTNGRISVVVRQISSNAPQRASYTNRIGNMNLTSASRPEVVVHEFGHAIEDKVYGSRGTVRSIANEFLRHRVGAEVPVPMTTVVPGASYRQGEMGRKDKFDEIFNTARAYYTGKEYADGSTEIVAMGLQKLYTDPGDFAARDPEFCKFILGILDGSLR